MAGEIADGHPRFAFVQTLRGLAPLLVVWAHLGSAWTAGQGVQWPVLETVELVTNPLRLFQSGGHLGVVLFFLISGFVVTHVSLRESVRGFLVRRLFRIWPMLAVSLLLTIGIVGLLNMLRWPPSFGIQDTGVINLMVNVVLLSWPLHKPHVLSVTWSLFIEVVFYLGTALLIPITRTRPLFATCIALASIPICIWLTRPIHESFDLRLMLYVPLLLVGRCIYFWTITRRRRWVVLAGACLLTFLGLAEALTPGFLLTRPNPPIFTYFYAVGLMVLLMKLPDRTPRPLNFVADVSYSLYLIHLPLGSLLLSIATRSGLGMTLSFALAVAGCLFASWMTFRIVELQSQAFGRRIALRWRMGGPVVVP